MQNSLSSKIPSYINYKFYVSYFSQILEMSLASETSEAIF